MSLVDSDFLFILLRAVSIVLRAVFFLLGAIFYFFFFLGTVFLRFLALLVVAFKIGGQSKVL